MFARLFWVWMLWWNCLCLHSKMFSKKRWMVAVNDKWWRQRHLLSAAVSLAEHFNTSNGPAELKSMLVRGARCALVNFRTFSRYSVCNVRKSFAMNSTSCMPYVRFWHPLRHHNAQLTRSMYNTYTSMPCMTKETRIDRCYVARHAAKCSHLYASISCVAYAGILRMIMHPS